MAIAVHADDDVFRSLVYGVPKSEDRDFLRGYIESAASRLGRGAEAFVAKARQRFESFDLRALDRKLESVTRKIRHGFDRDRIQPITKIGQYQHAGPTVQRWSLANPRVQRLLAAGRMNGWERTYSDPHRGKIGEDNPDYCKVVNGLARIDEHGHTKIVQYFNAYDADGREELNFREQVTIHDYMWSSMNAIIAQGQDDPTDEDNGSL